jgi:hypothetical protein
MWEADACCIGSVDDFRISNRVSSEAESRRRYRNTVTPAICLYRRLFSVTLVVRSRIGQDNGGSTLEPANPGLFVGG